MPLPTKIIISPSQSILLLIAALQRDQKLGISIDFDLESLKRLYLAGIDEDGSQQLFDRVKKDERLSAYHISEDSTVINNDPTRRYFETLLAYHTVIHGIPSIELSTLREVNNRLLKKLVTTEHPTPEAFRAHYLEQQESENCSSEPSFLLNPMRDKLFLALSPEDQDKYREIALIILLTVRLAKRQDFPFDSVYKRGLYFNKRERGRVNREDNGDLGSTRKGILRSGMPTPQDESSDDHLMEEDDRKGVPTQHMFRCVVSPFVRGPELHKPILSHAWPQKVFAALCHPFVSSISGIMLLQLGRLLNERENPLFINNPFLLNGFLRVFISLHLYSAGGHSIYEFSEVLRIPEVRKKLPPALNYTSIITLFLTGNKEVFDIALKKTIQYTETLLRNKQIFNELVSLTTTREVATRIESRHVINAAAHRIKNARKKYNDVNNRFFPISGSHRMRDTQALKIVSVPGGSVEITVLRSQMR